MSQAAVVTYWIYPQGSTICMSRFKRAQFQTREILFDCLSFSSKVWMAFIKSKLFYFERQERPKAQQQALGNETWTVFSHVQQAPWPCLRHCMTMSEQRWHQQLSSWCLHVVPPAATPGCLKMASLALLGLYSTFVRILHFSCATLGDLSGSRGGSAAPIDLLHQAGHKGQLLR